MTGHFAPFIFLIDIDLISASLYSLNTPPGTKVKLLGNVPVKNGILLLDDSKIAVLGGEVDHMIEKWALQRVRCLVSFALH